MRQRVANALLASSREYGYSELDPVMKMRVAASRRVLRASLSASPSFADARSDAKAQVEFGINVAQRGLWREAIYRWEKAVEIDPTYAAAFNDLAIAYEHEGQLDKARAGVREGARARAEQRPDPTELRAVQGNQ